MSQIYVPSSSVNPPPPGQLSTFVTDFYVSGGNYVAVGAVKPNLGNVIVSGFFNSQDNQNGITTVADPNNSNNLFIELTNRFSDIVIVGAGSVPSPNVATILTFPLSGGSAAYRFFLEVIAIDTTIYSTCGYTVKATFKTLGGVSYLVQDVYIDAQQDIPLNAISMQATGATNNVIMTFTNTINRQWAVRYTGYYIQI